MKLLILTAIAYADEKIDKYNNACEEICTYPDGEITLPRKSDYSPNLTRYEKMWTVAVVKSGADRFKTKEKHENQGH